jgi:hypothetical protein
MAEYEGLTVMPCAACEQMKDVDEAEGFCVIRKCTECGRPIRVREAGKHGIGVQIRQGDQPVMPTDMLTIAANPLKARGTLTRHGLEWFAELVFVGDLNRRRDDIINAISEMYDEYENVLKSSPLLAGFDLDSRDQAEFVHKKLEANKHTPEWWLYVAEILLLAAKEAIEKGDAKQAAWAMASAERFRSMYIFKEHFQEVVWMGHSAKRLVDFLHLWEVNRNNADEEFWQIQFQSHSFALAQLFSVPVTLIEGKAYVGGQQIDRTEARVVDFLFSGGNSGEAILIEIKTPTTPLLRKSPYRNVYPPTADLAGSVVQVSDYRDSLTKEFAALVHGKYDLSAFHPKCVVIVGNAEQLVSEKQRRSFELFRANLVNIEIVTFDELFKKLEQLALLFNLRRTDETAAAPSRPI